MINRVLRTLFRNGTYYNLNLSEFLDQVNSNKIIKTWETPKGIMILDHKGNLILGDLERND